MSGWTKGPWGGDSRKPTDIPIAGQHEAGISLWFVMGNEARMAEGRANACLISAAKDLAEAAELAEEVISAVADEIPEFVHSARVGSLRIVARELRAALLKAKGE